MNPPDPSGKHVTLRDIAKAMGISHSTVSLALRNHPRISAAVTQKVHQIAEKMGYKPDPMLAALAVYRRGKNDRPISSALAWVNAWPNPDDLRKHKEFDCYWKGASAAAAKFGYRLEEFRLDANNTPERLHQILSTRGIRGILLPPHFEQPDWGDFPWDQYSIVRFGRTLQSPCCHLVTADQVANTMLAYQEIHKRGYKRIGFVAHDFELKTLGIIFELGFLGGQRLVGAGEGPPTLLLGDVSLAPARKAFQQWLTKHKPDAILTTLPEMPAMLKTAGIKVPGQIGLAATTLLDISVNAGIDQHPEEIGRVGLLMLNSLITDGSRGLPKIFRQVLVEGSWVDGSDLPDVGKSAPPKKSSVSRKKAQP